MGLPARGGGLGVGERGIAAKVTKGCIKGAEALRAKYRGKVINVLTVNVYGFSRGAAAARHFMHVATNAPTTQKLSKINYKYIHLKYLKNLIKKSVRNSFCLRENRFSPHELWILRCLFAEKRTGC